MSSTEGAGDGQPENASQEQNKAIRLHVRMILRKLVARKRHPASC